MDNIIPITRSNKWFSEEDFILEQEFGREFLESDINFTIVLYKVDREQSQNSDIYGESVVDGIKFLPPYELKVLPVLSESENKVYSPNGTLRYIQDGRLSFSIYSSQLKELGVEIVYGDYVGYSVNETEIRYFTVVDDGIKNYDNKHTIMGYKGAFRTIVCAPVDNNEFRAY